MSSCLTASRGTRPRNSRATCCPLVRLVRARARAASANRRGSRADPGSLGMCARARRRSSRRRTARPSAPFGNWAPDYECRCRICGDTDWFWTKLNEARRQQPSERPAVLDVGEACTNKRRRQSFHWPAAQAHGTIVVDVCSTPRAAGANAFLGRPTGKPVWRRWAYGHACASWPHDMMSLTRGARGLAATAIQGDVFLVIVL